MTFENFIESWGNAANTALGFFWMALWAFILGYALSSLIQVFVTKKSMQKTMGSSNAKSVLIGTFLGFISSSCSFSALATTKSFFQKGASFVSSIAFLLASTNLVIELGIVISIFLGWQFVVGEYVGGILLILISWLLIGLINPNSIISKARKKLGEADAEKANSKPILEKIKNKINWIKVGKQYGMEWKMVWKDVTIGFTIAGIISAFVPDVFFQTLFINTGEGQTSFDFLTLLEHVIVGPFAAFITFIGSMGNIPLAALLFGKGVSFAGVMAFIFSDLVVFPVLRINAKYYGWKMSLLILSLLFVALIITSLVLHYSFDIFQILPDFSTIQILNQQYFQLNYTFYMNIGFLIISGILVYFGFFSKGKDISYMKEMAPKSPVLEKALKYVALLCYIWLFCGILIKYLY
ncbi:permease [Flavobacteriaceae bacterium 14752]|uniref:permease n=1 Tax=Mesohalobacter salilacus TaxID=2491711 RepID=UPI000F640422|nr:permease [Flavobacteriaceae bacterium 14752]